MTRLRFTPAEERHLRFIRRLPCVVSGLCPAEAAHVSYADAEWQKEATGLNTKAEPWFVVPLHRSMHAEQTNNGLKSVNEREWWRGNGFDPDAPGLSVLGLALDLWGCSERDDYDGALDVIAQHRMNICMDVRDREIPDPPVVARPVGKRRRGPGPKSRGFRKDGPKRKIQSRPLRGRRITETTI